MISGGNPCFNLLFSDSCGTFLKISSYSKNLRSSRLICSKATPIAALFFITTPWHKSNSPPVIKRTSPLARWSSDGNFPSVFHIPRVTIFSLTNKRSSNYTFTYDPFYPRFSVCPNGFARNIISERACVRSRVSATSAENRLQARSPVTLT